MCKKKIQFNVYFILDNKNIFEFLKKKFINKNTS